MHDQGYVTAYLTGQPRKAPAARVTFVDKHRGRCGDGRRVAPHTLVKVNPKPQGQGMRAVLRDGRAACAVECCLPRCAQKPMETLKQWAARHVEGLRGGVRSGERCHGVRQARVLGGLQRGRLRRRGGRLGLCIALAGLGCALGVSGCPPGALGAFSARSPPLQPRPPGPCIFKLKMRAKSEGRGQCTGWPH